VDSIDAHTLDDRSESSLRGVHPSLVRVVRLAHRMMCDDAPGLSFVVTEGLRSAERQRALVSAGASRTMNSFHLPRVTRIGEYGCAVDLAAHVDGIGIRWDWPLYPRIARRMKAAAGELGAAITWGGDWDGDGSSHDESFRDGPHFQIEGA
jgi:peptidoglycan L-alanyl-D-glutamate endopeptidase CwlK